MNIPATVTEQIENAENLELSYRTLHGYALLDYKDVNKTKIEFPFKSLTNKYKDFLSTIIIQIPLTEEEQEKYNEMVTFLKEQYPEVITYYDEESNRLITQNNLLKVHQNIYDKALYKNHFE